MKIEMTIQAVSREDSWRQRLVVKLKERWGDAELNLNLPFRAAKTYWLGRRVIVNITPDK